MTSLTLIQSFLPSNLFATVKENLSLFEEILNSMDIKSKNKRIRKKTFKNAAVQMIDTLERNIADNTSFEQAQKQEKTVSNEITQKQTNNISNKKEKKQEVLSINAVDVTESFDFQRLPVGFMLKLGKQFFEKEQIFRSYYNQNHGEYYKNKELLVSEFKKLVEQADNNIKKEIRPLIQSQLSS